MKKINSFFSNTKAKLPDSNKWIVWFLIALFFKSGIFIYKLSFDKPAIPNQIYTATFATEGGDTYSYLEPIETLIKTGKYTCKPFGDYRMPGYGAAYFAIRLFLSTTNSLNVLVLLQLILSSLSAYLLAKIAYLVFRKEKFFYLTFIIYTLSTFVSLFDIILLTESLCTSFLIFSLFFLLNFRKSAFYLVSAGFLMTWCIFLKPVLAPLLLLFALYVFLKGGKLNLKMSNYNWKGILLFIIPFVIIDGAWIIRNYSKYKKIIPLTSLYYSQTENHWLGSLYSFMNSFGGSLVYWNPGSDMSFFIPAPEHIKKKKNVLPPAYIYTSKFNYDSLLVVRKLIQDVLHTEGDSIFRHNNEQEVMTRLNTYTKSIKDEKPFLYYISSRFKVFRTFFVHSGTYNLFERPSFELNPLEWTIKVAYSLLYAIVIIGGFLGSFCLIFNGAKNTEHILVSLIGLYTALVFPFLLKLDESRYFVTGYPFFVLSCIYFLGVLKAKKLNLNDDTPPPSKS